jgi:hypothetical protein
MRTKRRAAKSTPKDAQPEISRREILRKGAKVGYVAPLVLGSVTAAEIRVDAVSSCPAGKTAASGPAVCGW